ncbi:LacI family DNA-binding transcriptional regulator [Oenococcus oeni]|uniref:LacI family DNA-binding transcriptional regulator n=1 Tax=Oenococcus oeni TaxID=1247 RepID=UPI000277B601|nr:LacI family DNA-binding transcriptional regulator [Oenococcus oeni]EJO05066.1 LacI family transcription regulator [Oenococcus oeni AWRIB548]EJO08007.1 LacI family transcription regulator [Oenococcus oeni AWRIB422]KEP86231.1 transcriptional regulator [Oenococcus oeni IOEB_0205]KGH68140.1 transcriptional regulator [Oenococcus oeni IOEB_B16]OIL79506.1 transcriptional regulator [Oenococcus oeni]
MKNNKRATINDVAEVARVSITTVSRYVNGKYGKMSAKTRQKIQQAIKDVDYHVNRQAQMLKRQNSHLIGVVVADVENFFSSLLFKGADQVLSDIGFQIILMNSNNSQLKEQRQIERLLELQMDGIILQPMGQLAVDYEFLKKQNVPTVIVDRKIEPEIWPEIVTDNYECSKKLGELMLQMQYPQILILSEKIDENTARQDRYKALDDLQKNHSFNLGLIEIKVTSSDDDIFVSLKNRTNNFKIKTAIYALKGPLLLRLMRVLTQRHISVPDQVGLAAFDDWEWAKLTHPLITTIQQNPKLIGSTAANKLLEEIQESETQASVITVKSQLMVGHSL